MNKKSILALFITALILFPVTTFSKEVANNEPAKYMMPAKEIAALVDAPLTPVINISPDKQLMLMIEPAGLPSIDEISQPELKLAGVRINPVTNGPSHQPYYKGVKLKNLNTGEEFKITGLPAKPKINYVTWAPDGKNFAFILTSDKDIQLWNVNIAAKRAKRLSNLELNFTLGRPFYWLSDNKTIICTVLDKKR